MQTSIGSFHSHTPRQLLLDFSLRLPKPLQVSSKHEDILETAKTTQFGADFRKFFCLDDSKVFLNHGAFGAPLKHAQEESNNWRLYAERQPVRFIDRELFSHWIQSLEALSFFLHTDPLQMVLVPNVTFGLWSVLQSLVHMHPLNAISIVYFNFTYGGTKKMLLHLKSLYPEITLTEISTQWPLEVEEITATLLEHDLVVLDYITSATALKLPIRSICSQIKAGSSAKVLVDAAHGPLASSLSPSEMGADYVVGNCHKWLCSPRGVGFLWVSDGLEANISPCVPSHGILMDDLQSRFLWIGNQDYSAMLVLPTVLGFWKAVGEDRVRRYQIDLQKRVIGLWSRLYGMSESEALICSDLSMRCGAMVLLRLPVMVSENPMVQLNASFLQDLLFDMGFEVPVKCIDGWLYLRLSFHVYNYTEEYEKLFKCINDKFIVN